MAGDHRSGKGLPALPGEQDRPVAGQAPLQRRLESMLCAVPPASARPSGLSLELALTAGLAETQPCRPSGFEALFGYNDAASR